MKRTFYALLLLAAAACTPDSQHLAPAITPTVATPDTRTERAFKTETFTAPLEGSEASITLDIPFEKTFISQLDDSENLIEAEVEYTGEAAFTQADAQQLTLKEIPGDDTYEGDKPLRWNVLLSPDVALDLDLTTDSGELTLDASALTLTTLALDTVSGVIDADLPAAPAQPVTADVDVTSGEINVNMPDDAAVNFKTVNARSGTIRLNIGAGASVNIANVEIESGWVVVDVPPQTAVRLEIQEVGSGMVNIAYGMQRLSGTGSNEGIWETAGFASAANRITIVVNRIGSGTFELE